MWGCRQKSKKRACFRPGDWTLTPPASSQRDTFGMSLKHNCENDVPRFNVHVLLSLVRQRFFFCVSSLIFATWLSDAPLFGLACRSWYEFFHCSLVRSTFFMPRYMGYCLRDRCSYICNFNLWNCDKTLFCHSYFAAELSVVPYKKRSWVDLKFLCLC